MTYAQAYNQARQWANETNQETGVEKCQEFNRWTFRPRRLPRPENRCGWELRCQIVRPGEPEMQER